MNPHYYLMKNKKVLRLEAGVTFESLPSIVKEKLLDASDLVALDQEQANWRVVIFGDEILEYEEYVHWLSIGEEEEVEEEEYALTAN